MYLIGVRGDVRILGQRDGFIFSYQYEHKYTCATAMVDSAVQSLEIMNSAESEWHRCTTKRALILAVATQITQAQSYKDLMYESMSRKT